ncbi:unnamed protein product [Soboliphyme baturini]|uniref:Kinase n=1 Tax=Soboliphyme baturini TaxID=241478 RepID=A0A183IJZ2_9BILA|nr:unnamed protein product [Soboliphyme baturini]
MGQRERRDRRPSTRSDDNVSDKVALLEPFSHQVGGHACFLSLEERTLCKPFTYRESKFYQSLPAELTSFVPEFRGKLMSCPVNLYGFGVDVVYDEVSGKYNCYGKYLGRRLTVDGFKQVIKSYFHNGVQFHSVLIDSLIPKLQTLSKILFCCNGFRFFSSSLLVIYDGDRYNNEVADIDIRMIDFEHSTFPGFKDDPSYDGPDTGYLKGIESLISVMRQIQRDAYDAK